MKKTILFVFGTRPEAIKVCPLVQELNGRKNVEVLVCVSGQHREMLSDVLQSFGIMPDYDLAVMSAGQTLSGMTERLLSGIGAVFDAVRPDLVLVHGDTTTAFAAALSCFYKRIAIAHVEAGLRTYDRRSPYPEEFNRRAISLMADYHFVPTDIARENLIREGIPEKSIHLTGNTVLDALRLTLRKHYTHRELEWARASRLVILTAHRRENLGEPMRAMFRAIRRTVEEHPDVKVVYPIHKNPEVRRIAEAELSECERIHTIEPLSVADFHNFLARAYMILTDSGGIQEEATALGKPTLVMRDTTERPEGIVAGTLKLVGTDEELIYDNFKLLLESREAYEAMSKASTLYGGGHASRRIADILESNLTAPT